MHTIVELYEFQQCAKVIGMEASELDSLKTRLAESPDIGIELGSGLYKIRLAKKGRGKSGGYRVIYFYRKKDIPLILISAFAKNSKINLTSKELKEYRKLCDILEAQYRSTS